LHFLRGQGLHLAGILLQNSDLRVLLLLQIGSFSCGKFLSGFFGGVCAFLKE
jgi:hypothetical protein